MDNGNIRRDAEEALSPFALTMVYMPMQALVRVYTPEQALTQGTLFPELDKPLVVASRGRYRV